MCEWVLSAARQELSIVKEELSAEMQLLRQRAHHSQVEQEQQARGSEILREEHTNAMEAMGTVRTEPPA